MYFFFAIKREMEEWQKELISKNLAELIELTDCNTGLLTRLETCRILGTDDIEKLNLLGLTRSQQTREFYTIIKTRSNSFEALLKALNETKQSGALDVLSGESYFDDTQIRYDVYSELGKGSYGTIVYKGKIGDRTVAVKMVHSNLMGGVQALHEVKILKDCDAHENVIRYFGAKRVGTAIVIVLELCDMSLKEWVEKKYNEILHMEVLRQITTGLEWLHSQKIVHRDIKPENVLIVRHLKRVKLSDFGLSRSILDGNSFVATANVAGTSGWMATEILAHREQESQTECKFTYASDVFSLGCVYYYVLSDGKNAFGNPIRCQVNILDGKSMIAAQEIQHGCSQNILFINLMILQDPKSRPTCTKILSYPLFWSQNRRVRFIEKLLSQIGGGMEKISSYTTQDPCRFDHTPEIRTLRDLNSPANQGIGCVLPFAFTQYTSEQVDKLLEHEMTNPEHLARGNPIAESTKTMKLETIRNGEKIDGMDKTALAGSDLISCQVKGENTKTVSTKTLESSSKQEDALASDKNVLQRFNKPETIQSLKPNPHINTINSEAADKSELELIQSKQNQAKINTELNALKKMDLKANKYARLVEIVKKENFNIIKGVLQGIATKLDITQLCCNQQEQRTFWNLSKLFGPDTKDKSLLHVAVARGNYDVVDYLVNNAFGKVLSEPRFEHSLVHACIKDIHEIDADAFTQKCRILELLFTKAPHLIESKRDDGYTPLLVAVSREFVNGKQVEFIEMLLSHNPNLNATESWIFNTPLHLLFWNKSVPENAFEIMRLLIII